MEPPLPARHLLHPGYGHATLRAWHGAGAIAPTSLVYPLFIVDDDDARQPIGAMPGQCRWGVRRLAEALDGPVADGLAAVLLFGVIDDAAKKDATASCADAATAPVVRAVAALRARYPALLVMCDLCLCGYTDHGHCGVLRPAAPGATAADEARKPAGEQAWAIDNDASVARLGQLAAAYAAAGAHVIAPSDMMDGRVAAIKAALRRGGFGSTVSVMSYAAKFASCFYGPFRDAAHSGMAFGDRSLYQLPPGSRGLAMRCVCAARGGGVGVRGPGQPGRVHKRCSAHHAPLNLSWPSTVHTPSSPPSPPPPPPNAWLCSAVERDLQEGADFVMVKPGMPYLDIIRDTADRARVPVAVYQVRGVGCDGGGWGVAGAPDRLHCSGGSTQPPSPPPPPRVRPPPPSGVGRVRHAAPRCRRGCAGPTQGRV